MSINKFVSVKTFEKLRPLLQGIFLFLLSISLIFSFVNDSFLKFIRFILNLNPLFYLSESLANLKPQKELAITLAFIFFLLLFGRLWCGWICPLGTLLEYSPKRKKTIDLYWLHSIKHLVWLSILFLSLFGSLTLLIFDPITIFIRTFSVIFWPLVYYLLRFIEWLAFKVPFLGEHWNNFLYSTGLTSVLDKTPYFKYSQFVLFLFVLILGLNLVAERFWCRYLCPLGGFLSFLSKFSFFRLSPTKKCAACKNCLEVCPTNALNLKENLILEFSECILCLRCINTCRRSEIKTVFSWRESDRSDFDPEKRVFLLSIFTSLFLNFLLRINPEIKKKDLLRPPGATENSLNLKCVRCGACIKSCPTGAIQPSLLEAGVKNFWTPMVVPRIGYCDYNCNRCGQVCPYGAIPNLELDLKQKVSLGKAVINKKICLPWSQGKPCLVCEEACPVPNKAIELEENEVVNDKGRKVKILVPVVHYCRCIGCGVCENKCPVKGQSAIRVFRKEFVKHKCD